MLISSSFSRLSSKSSKYIRDVGENAPKRAKMFSGYWDTLLFGISIKWSVLTTLWHMGLRFGFREYMIALSILSVGYCMLLCSLAEMVSVIAFPGGYYGYARCAIHPLFGYLVGCSGVIETVTLTAATVLRISQSITLVCGSSVKLEPLWWVILHLAVILVHSQPGRFYWYCLAILSAICVVIFSVFLLGSIPEEDFGAHTQLRGDVDIFTQDWFEILSIPAIFYFGCDLVVVISNEVPESKKVIPRVMLSVYALMTVLAVALIFTVVSQAPGLTSELYTIAFPLTFGFRNMMGVSLDQAVAYIIAPMASTVLGYMLISGRMLRSLALSGLLPRELSWAFGQSQTPLPAMIATSSVGLCLQAVAWTQDVTLSSRVILHSAFFVHIGMCICYVVFKHRYGHLERAFTSPFGVPGAVLGFGIFVLALTSMLMSSINHIASMLYGTWMGMFIIYWFLFAERQQTFTGVEQHEFFKVYLINSKLLPFTTVYAWLLTH